MGQKKLSILISSLKERENLLKRLLDILNRQANDEVEIIVDVDDGEKTIGEKRQGLLEKCCGDYVCFVDDDDTVAEDYVKKILEALKNEPDCVAIEGIWMDNKGNRNIYWGKGYKWQRKDDCYYIGTNHITPVRRDFALNAGFRHIDIGEDQDYGGRVRMMAKKEAVVKGPIYFYHCDASHAAVYRAHLRHKK